jgi:hypothetical protein
MAVVAVSSATSAPKRIFFIGYLRKWNVAPFFWDREFCGMNGFLVFLLSYGFLGAWVAGLH